MNFSKMLDIEMKLQEEGLSKEEEMKLLIKKHQMMNKGDGDLMIYFILYGIMVVMGIALLLF